MNTKRTPYQLYYALPYHERQDRKRKFCQSRLMAPRLFRERLRGRTRFTQPERNLFCSLFLVNDAEVNW